MRGEAKYWLFLVLVVGAVIGYEVVRPRPLDWTPTLVPGDTRPYGAEVLHRLLPQLAGDAVIESYSPLRTLLDDEETGTIFILADEAAVSPFDVERLLGFVEGGGTVLVAAHRLSVAFDDTLGISTVGGVFGLLVNPFVEDVDTTHLWFSAPGLADSIEVTSALVPATIYHQGADTLRWEATVHALVRREAGHQRDFDGPPSRDLVLRFEAGEGALIYTNAPLLLSNFGLLNSEGRAFAERLFAYVPEGPLVWWRRGAGEAATPLRYLLGQDSLRWSLWTALIGVLLFMVTAARRRERPVPTLLPPRNDTLDFARTIGLLYFNRGDHANLAAKLRHQFYAYARDTLGIGLAPTDPAFAERVAQRSGVPLTDVQALLKEIAYSERHDRLSQHELLSLGRAVNAFYRASTRSHPTLA